MGGRECDVEERRGEPGSLEICRAVEGRITEMSPVWFYDFSSFFGLWTRVLMKARRTKEARRTRT